MNSTRRTIEVSGVGPVRTLTLSRPESGNAIDASLHNSLAGIWDELRDESEVRVVVLTGAGKAFCTGGDIDWFSALSSDATERNRVLREGRKILYGMLDFPGPIVAAVNGPAVGLGATLVSLCDFVVMSSTAFLSDPHVSIGLVAADGGAMTWPLIMGLQRAKEKLLTGDRISASEALEYGLASQVVPTEQVLPAALDRAGRLATQPRLALESTRRVLNLPVRRAIDGAIDLAFALEDATFQDPEHVERVQNFLKARSAKESREP